MKNICFIGTSHLGAIAQAWNKWLHALYPNFNPTFFGGPGTSLYQAEFLEHTIQAPAASALEEYFKLSAGLSTIELSQYQAFIFQGLDYPINSFIELAQLSQEETSHEEQQFFSESCMEIGTIAKLQESPVNIYVEHIRKYTESPIIISISPRLSILAIEKQPELYQQYLKQADYFEHLFVYARQQVFNYPNITFLDQPKDTLADEALGFTKYEYLNSYGKIKPENTQDLGHKNPKYGKLVLAKIMEQLQAFDF